MSGRSEALQTRRKTYLKACEAAQEAAYACDAAQAHLRQQPGDDQAAGEEAVRTLDESVRRSRALERAAREMLWQAALDAGWTEENARRYFGREA